MFANIFIYIYILFSVFILTLKFAIFCFVLF